MKRNLQIRYFPIFLVMTVSLYSFRLNDYLDRNDLVLLTDFFFDVLFSSLMFLYITRNVASKINHLLYLIYFVLLKVLVGIYFYPLNFLENALFLIREHQSIQLEHMNGTFSFIGMNLVIFDGNLNIIQYLMDWWEAIQSGQIPVHYLGNALLLVPFSYYLVNEKKWQEFLYLKALLFVFLLELFQSTTEFSMLFFQEYYLINRQFDLADILFNYLGFVLFLFIFQNVRRRLIR